MSFKARLKGMQQKMEELQEGYVPGGNSQQIPDDDYSLRVKATINETSKAPARIQISFCFVVAEGEYEGVQVWNNCIIEDNKTGAQIARGVIEDLGYTWPADELELLEDIVNDITERSPLIEATVRTKENAQGYMNSKIKINNVLELPEGSEGGEVQTNEGPAGEETPGPDAGEKKDLQKQALLDLAASLGIDGFTAENELADMIEALKACDLKYPKENFTEEELGLVTALDIANLVEEPKKVAVKPVVLKKATPPSAPATASKTVTKPAGKLFSKKGKK
jgi:hypothetical protein